MPPYILSFIFGIPRFFFILAKHKMISKISINKIRKVNYKVQKLIVYIYVCQNSDPFPFLFSCGSLKPMWLGLIESVNWNGKLSSVYHSVCKELHGPLTCCIRIFVIEAINVVFGRAVYHCQSVFIHVLNPSSCSQIRSPTKQPPPVCLQLKVNDFFTTREEKPTRLLIGRIVFLVREKTMQLIWLVQSC